MEACPPLPALLPCSRASMNDMAGGGGRTPPQRVGARVARGGNERAMHTRNGQLAPKRRIIENCTLEFDADRSLPYERAL